MIKWLKVIAITVFCGYLISIIFKVSNDIGLLAAYYTEAESFWREVVLYFSRNVGGKRRLTCLTKAKSR